MSAVQDSDSAQENSRALSTEVVRPKRQGAYRGDRPSAADRTWWPVFLSQLRATGNVRASCLAAGIDRSQAFRDKGRFPEFAEEWNDAMEDATDALEAAARVRAQKGSDLLMIFLLKAHRPEKFRDNYRPPQTDDDESDGPLVFEVRRVEQRPNARIIDADAVEVVDAEA